MRFGLFYEHQLPRPWEDGAHERLLHDALDQIELADRVGFDYVWEVEHHFLEEYSHSSAPEVFLAAASQRTQRIRLGHGIVQIPPPFNHPARVAERAATLDLLSGGRLDLGTGEASSQMELGGFGIDRASKREMWEEALDAIARMFVEEPYAGADGRFVQMPPRNVMPKPRQRPHPPLWVACSRRDTILLAARKGLGALSFSFVEPEQAKEWVDEYYALIASEECVPGGFAVNPNFAVVLPMMCHDDEATAIERGIDGAHFFGYSLGVLLRVRRDAARRDEPLGRLRAQPRPARLRALDRHAGPGAARREAVPGGARLAARRDRHAGSDRGPRASATRRAGVDQVIFVLQAGKNRHEHICESIELFAERGAAALRGASRRASSARSASAWPRRASARWRGASRHAPAPDYVVEPMSEPRPADGDRRAHARRLRTRASLGGLVQQAGEAAFAALVRGRSDAQLERTVGLARRPASHVQGHGAVATCPRRRRASRARSSTS